MLTLAALSMILTLSGCGQDAPVPDVVGMQLDKAHQALAAADFEDFEDEDFFEDRSILLDANWVVLEQDPTAGTSTGTGTTITLRAGKTAEEQAAEASQRGEDQAARGAAILAYVNSVDPILPAGAGRPSSDPDRRAGSPVR